MKRALLVVGSIALVTSGLLAAVTLQWETRKSPGIRRQGGVVGAGLNGKFYVFGGNGPTAGTTTEIYDPATDTWSYGANMPTRRESPNVAVVDGKLYLIGGTDPAISNGDYHKGQLTSVEMYDPATNTWTTKASLNFKRDVAGVGVVNGKIYSIGGMYGELDLPEPENLDTVEMYDPNVDKWTVMPSRMPTAMRAMAYTTIGSKVYLFGGCAGRSAAPCTRTDVMVYDTTTDTWATIDSPLPVGRHFSGQGAVTVGLKALVFGGASDFSRTVYGNVELFDPATLTWQELTPMKTARKSGAGAILDGYLYSVGGHTDGTFQIGGDVNERTSIEDLLKFDGAATASGTSSSLTLDVSLATEMSDAAQTGQIYVVANLGSQWYSFTSSGWVPWLFGSTLQAYSSGALPSSTTIRVLSSTDVRAYRGASIHVAYGRSQTDMMTRQLYKQVYTIQ